MIFTSTPQTNHDPEPWREVDSYGPRHDKGAAHGYYGSRFQPRPQFNGSPVNPILVALREHFVWDYVYRAIPSEWPVIVEEFNLDGNPFEGVSAEQVDHARRVIDRLVALS